MLFDKDVPYRTVEEWDPKLNCLDIFYRKPTIGSQPRPVIVFIHGGGWTDGDKSDFSADANHDLHQYFVHIGCVVVAPNFRLALDPNRPNTTIADMAMDIAKALKWLNVNVRKYGGQSSGFVLWGYSSGAHLAALVATDDRYLNAYRLNKDDIRGVIAMDVPQYDVPRAFEVLRTQDVGGWNEMQRIKSLQKLFGRTDHQRKRFSPAHFLTEDVKPNSFLLVSSGYIHHRHQTFSYKMSVDFKDQLTRRGGDAWHVHFDDYDHHELISRYLDREVASIVESYLHHLGLSTRPAGGIPG